MDCDHPISERALTENSQPSRARKRWRGTYAMKDADCEFAPTRNLNSSLHKGQLESKLENTQFIKILDAVCEDINRTWMRVQQSATSYDLLLTTTTDNANNKVWKLRGPRHKTLKSAGVHYSAVKPLSQRQRSEHARIARKDAYRQIVVQQSEQPESQELSQETGTDNDLVIILFNTRTTANINYIISSLVRRQIMPQILMQMISKCLWMMDIHKNLRKDLEMTFQSSHQNHPPKVPEMALVQARTRTHLQMLKIRILSGTFEKS